MGCVLFCFVFFYFLVFDFFLGRFSGGVYRCCSGRGFGVRVILGS